MDRLLRIGRVFLGTVAMLEIIVNFFNLLFHHGVTRSIATVLFFWSVVLAIIVYFDQRARGNLIGKKKILNSIVLSVVAIGVSLYGLATFNYNHLQVLHRQTVPVARAALWKEANKHRANPLPLDPVLNDTAQTKCNQIVATNNFSHDGLRQVADKLHRTMGENLAEGYGNSGQVLEGWATSPGHNANLINPDWKHVGYGICSDPIHGIVVVQHFSN
jgi:Cysteine-rich secretory protein family